MPAHRKDGLKMEQVKLTLPRPIIDFVDDIMEREGFLSHSHVFIDALKFWRDKRG